MITTDQAIAFFKAKGYQDGEKYQGDTILAKLHFNRLIGVRVGKYRFDYVHLSNGVWKDSMKQGSALGNLEIRNGQLFKVVLLEE